MAQTIEYVNILMSRSQHMDSGNDKCGDELIDCTLMMAQ